MGAELAVEEAAEGSERRALESGRLVLRLAAGGEVFSVSSLSEGAMMNRLKVVPVMMSTRDSL